MAERARRDRALGLVFKCFVRCFARRLMVGLIAQRRCGSAASPFSSPTTTTSTCGCGITIRDAIGRTRTYANELDLAHAVPSASLASTGSRIANPGAQYLVDQPSSGALTLMTMDGTYNYEWYNPATGTVAGTGSMAVAAGTQTFTPPFSGAAVLLLTR